MPAQFEGKGQPIEGRNPVEHLIPSLSVNYLIDTDGIIFRADDGEKAMVAVHNVGRAASMSTTSNIIIGTRRNLGRPDRVISAVNLKPGMRSWRCRPRRATVIGRPCPVDGTVHGAHRVRIRRAIRRRPSASSNPRMVPLLAWSRHEVQFGARHRRTR